MKTMTGAGIGALAVGVTLLAYMVGAGSSGASMRSDRAWLESRQMRLASDGTVGVNGAQLASTGIDGAFVVTCDLGQRAVVRRSVLDGQIVNQVGCVSVGLVDGLGRSVATDPAGIIDRSNGDAQLVRAGYPVSQRTYSSGTSTYRRPIVRRTPNRSWQKSALIIGGTAGAGAGIGAAVGGRKGALLGAAIGGGAATLYDQLTRRPADR